MQAYTREPRERERYSNAVWLALKTAGHRIATTAWLTALVILLGALGTPDAQAIALGLVHYLATVAVSALGAPAFAAGYRPTKPGRADPETPLPE